MSRRLGFAALLAAVAVYYLFLLSNGTFQLFAPELLDKAFNSMLVHLLRGEFDLDPGAIGYEGFSRLGKTYTYFGPLPALLRLVAMPFANIDQAHLARLSCLTAVVVFVALQLRALLVAHDSLPPTARMPLFLGAMVAATALSGPQVYILGSAWIYHEPILWAAAMGAGFNLVVARAAFAGAPLHRGDLAWLAVLAGLSLLTRASAGVALYLGTALLVTWSAWRRHRPGVRDPADPPAAMSAVVRDPSLWLPMLILGALAGAVGFVNFERWGNPLAFADINYYDVSHLRPNDLTVYHRYGDFNVGRLWIGALYYATGLPWLLKTMSPFTEYFRDRYLAVEGPPMSPLLTGPLTVLLAGVGVYRLCRKPDLPSGGAAILRLALVGHAAAVLLIFSAMYLALRYRFDFAPFMTLAALVGYRSVSLAAAAGADRWRRRLRVAAVTLCAVGILGSHYVLIVHKVWSFGTPIAVRRALLPLVPFGTPALEQQ